MMKRDGVLPAQTPATSAELERFRTYLRFLADVKLDRRRRRVDASDIVQETLLKAYGAWDDFRGNDSGQRIAWLRQILMRTILHALRDARCAKRDVAREQHLNAVFDESSRRIEQWLAGGGGLLGRNGIAIWRSRVHRRAGRLKMDLTIWRPGRRERKLADK